MEHFLQRGESKIIHFFMNRKTYDAKIVNVNNSVEKRKKDAYQIRYTRNGDLSQALQQYFFKTMNYIRAIRESRDLKDRSYIKMPEGLKEYLVNIGWSSDQFGLKDVEKKKVKNFSLGMRQRLGIANALMGNPKLLILDEPINGLDPMGIIEIRELLKKINKEKDMTILISSHILSELSELATTYGIISNGKLIEEITSEELAEKCRQYIDLKVDDTSRAVTLLERELGISDYEVLEDKKIKVFSNLENVGEVNSILSKSGVIVESISVKGENLEEYFMNTVGGVLNA